MISNKNPDPRQIKIRVRIRIRIRIRVISLIRIRINVMLIHNKDKKIHKKWCRKREEKEKEVERLLLDKENQVLEARIKLSNAEQNKFNLGQF